MSQSTQRNETLRTRSRIELSGTVQGVGFRPFVYRLARELGLAGWVRNSPSGVAIEVEGEPGAIEQLYARLNRDLPPNASIESASQRDLPVERASEFCIEASAFTDPGAPPADILPDLAICPECLAEICDPSDRRYGYPFTNCLQCGPRFSIVLDLPWDRPNTTMREFTMCPACQAEYEAPDNRRFHAQPNACPECGPQLSWLDASGLPLATRSDALEQAALAIESGAIAAIKGIGGFHLFADARNSETIAALRERKHRPAKPLAVMMPSLEVAAEHLDIDDDASRLLSSAAAPIVLLPRREDCRLPPDLAPGNPELGALLPYSPLHHLLMRRLGFPVVATSGNRGGEPICIGNTEAVNRLRGIADHFLVHDRPIARPVDDSVMRVVAGEPVLLRRSRGFAPSPISVPDLTQPVLAVGGDLKNTIALSGHGRVRISQHFGDLASLESMRALENHLADLPKLCAVTPRALACDPHPAYHSNRQAEESGLPLEPVQHHHAHAVACAAENGISPDEEFLAIVWDGTGFGLDGTIWGGEFLVCWGSEFERFACGHFRMGRRHLPSCLACSNHYRHLLARQTSPAFVDLPAPLASEVTWRTYPIFSCLCEFSWCVTFGRGDRVGWCFSWRVSPGNLMAFARLSGKNPRLRSVRSLTQSVSWLTSSRVC